MGEGVFSPLVHLNPPALERSALMKQEMVLNLYVRIPDQLLVTLLEDGMDLTDVYLLGYLRRGLHGQGYSFQGDRFLSGLLHINPRQIQRHIRKLEEKGYLIRRHDQRAMGHRQIYLTPKTEALFGTLRSC